MSPQQTWTSIKIPLALSGGGNLSDVPRLSPNDYLKAYKHLRYLWLNQSNVYSYLRPTEQWQLHKFFRPSEELSKEELLQHRKDITIKNPSLPHQAGKALKEFDQVMHSKVKARGVTGLKTQAIVRGNRSVQVRSLVRPQIDIPRLARALIELGERKTLN